MIQPIISFSQDNFLLEIVSTSSGFYLVGQRGDVVKVLMVSPDFMLISDMFDVVIGFLQKRKDIFT